MMKNIIESNPSIMMGKPVVAGTRITVELILEKLAAGETIDEILEAHPRLTREAIQAAINSQTKKSFINLSKKVWASGYKTKDVESIIKKVLLSKRHKI